MGFKTSGFPDFRFNPMGFRKSFRIIQNLIKECGLFAYYKDTDPPVDNVWPEQTGDFPSDAQVRNYVLLGDGSVKATFGTGSEAITYFDMDTGLEVNTNLTLGEYTFLLGVKYDWVEIDATGEFYNMQETDGDFLLSNRGNTAQLENAPEPSALWIADDKGVSAWNGVGGRVSGAFGKNLFNKDATNTIPNTFVSTADGSLQSSGSGLNVFTIYVKDISEVFKRGSFDNGWRVIDRNGNLLDFGSSFDPNTFSWTVDAEFLQVSIRVTDYDAGQIEEGSTATTYEAWDGPYYEPEALNPMPDGVYIPAITTLQTKTIKGVPTLVEVPTGDCNAYNSAGELVKAQYVGEIMRDISVTGDGVMDITNSHSQIVIDRTLADNDPDEIYVDKTDESNLVAKVVANSSIITGVAGQTGYIYNNQYFYKIDDGVIVDTMLFDEPLTFGSDCYEKATKKLDLIEYAVDLNGEYAVDLNGDMAYALKETVVSE